jgi:hypothetical protein
MSKIQSMTILNSKQWKELLKKARKGDDEAQWEVGSYYEDGLKDNEGNIDGFVKSPISVLRFIPRHCGVR